METRNSAIVVSLYLLGGIIVGVVCFAYYSHHRSANLLIEEQAQQERSAANRMMPPQHTAAIAKANKSVIELQRSLADSRQMLSQRNAALNQKTMESQTLREQLDHALMLLVGLLDEDSTLSRLDGETDGAMRARVETELSQLQESIGKSDSPTPNQADQLLQLQAELIQADLHLATLQEQTKRDLEVLAAEKRTVEEAASEVVAKCGAMAVPLLIDLLADERVEVRRWAAKAIGSIGHDARDASQALRELLSDPDPTVRAEVEQALAKMD